MTDNGGHSYTEGSEFRSDLYHAQGNLEIATELLKRKDEEIQQLKEALSDVINMMGGDDLHFPFIEGEEGRVEGYKRLIE